MANVGAILRACVTTAKALAGRHTAGAPDERATAAATSTNGGVDVEPWRIDKTALAAMYLQARFPVLALQYIAALDAGAKPSRPLRAELMALSHLADAFGFTFSAGNVLLIGKE